MIPCIVIDTETTGLPNRPRGWEPRIIEIGAVVITADLEAVEPISSLVQQPRKHLEDPRAAGALGLADLTPDKILSEGRDEDRLSTRLACWVGQMMERHGVQEIRAYNQSFDFGFLYRAPWCLQACGLAEGECVMLAAQSIMGPAGALPRWASGEYKWPRSSEAVEFFRSRGHTIEWEGLEHRALRDAAIEAQVAIAIERERSA